MKTVRSTNQLLIAVESDKMPHVPKGKIHITTVQYRTFEYTPKELDDTPGKFEVHDANCKEAKLIAQAVAL